MDNKIKILINGSVSKLTKDDISLDIDIKTTEDNFHFRIEGNYSLKDKENKLVDLSYLSNLQVVSITASNNSPLIVNFSNNVCLIVPPDENFEAWEFHSSKGKRIICMPGGKLAIWN